MSATLALMKDRFRGQIGNVELVKRLMATADDGLHEDDDSSHDGITSVEYGAGVVDPEAALKPVGALSTGIAGSAASLGATRLCTPTAYGDAAVRIAHVEVAAFDAGNAPFWIRAGQLMEAGPTGADPIPRFEDDTPAGTGCAALAAVAPRWYCPPFGEDGKAGVLFGDDGAGLRVRSSPDCRLPRSCGPGAGSTARAGARSPSMRALRFWSSVPSGAWRSTIEDAGRSAPPPRLRSTCPGGLGPGPARCSMPVAR